MSTKPNEELINWFYPHADAIAKSMGIADEQWKGGIPLLVRDAWDHQQKKIDNLEATLDILIAKIGKVKATRILSEL